MTEHFTSYKDISASFGLTNGIRFLDGDRDLPYLKVGDLFYYFGQVQDVLKPTFQLVMTASKDIDTESR